MLLPLLLSLSFGCRDDPGVVQDSVSGDSADTGTADTQSQDTGDGGDTGDSGDQNTLPDAPVLYWGNAAPVAGQDANTCLSGAATDPDGDALSLEITWTQDGVPYSGPFDTESFPGDAGGGVRRGVRRLGTTATGWGRQARLPFSPWRRAAQPQMSCRCGKGSMWTRPPESFSWVVWYTLAQSD